MLKSEEINLVGNILNTTWGRAATAAGNFPAGTAPALSITANLMTDVDGEDESTLLVVKYLDIVTFRSDREAYANIKTFRDIAEKTCAAKLSKLKEQFRESSDRALRIKFKTSHDSVESIYTPTPATSAFANPSSRPELFRGYYRYTAVYKLS